MLSPAMAPMAAAAITQAMLSRPVVPAKIAAVTSAVSPGAGMPMLSRPTRTATSQYPCAAISSASWCDKTSLWRAALLEVGGAGKPREIGELRQRQPLADDRAAADDPGGIRLHARSVARRRLRRIASGRT